MTAKHTPGPWMATTENRGAIPEHFRPFSVTDATGGRVVARLPDGRGPEDTANARLIAAAPDLLEACKAARGAYAALALVNPRADYSHPLANLEAALAKAGI